MRQLLDRQGDLAPLDCPAEVESHAPRLVAQLVNEAPSGEGRDLQLVDVGTLELIRPRSVGVEHAGLWAMEELGLEELLERVGLYRASDALMSHRAAIETHLFDRATDLFGLRRTVTLYDLTNTFFEGGAATQSKAQRGHSKEKRSDCPLLTLGLVLDGSGFVRRSEVFSGAVKEDTTLASMLKALGAPADAPVVMDAGIATEANIAWLRANGTRYLAVSRERTRRFDPELAQAIETRSRQTVHIHKALDPDSGETRLYCYSEARAKKERGIADRFATRFEGELKTLHDGLSRPRTRKRLDRVWQRIGRIAEKSRGAGAHYDIDVIADDSGKKARAVIWKRRPLAGSMLTHPGVYCLRTNVRDWDKETLWRTYTSLTDVEATCRSFKSELGLRPIFHRTQTRSDGHLFITVIACQMVQTIRHRLAGQGQHACWAAIRAILEGQQRVTATFQRKDGRTLHVRKATRAEPGQLQIYRALDLDRTMLGNWTGRAVQVLSPVIDRMIEHLQASDCLFVDETTVPVLAPGTGKTRRDYLWAVARDQRGHGGRDPPIVVFHHSRSRSAKTALRLLGDYAGGGVLHVDGYRGYDALADPGRIRNPWGLAYCWIHWRRRFVEFQRSSASPICEEVIARIAALYRIEAMIRGKTPEQRLEARRELSAPIVEALHSWLDAQLARLSDASELARHIKYALRRWNGLTRFLRDGRVEMDTNPVENAIRPIPLTRKNALFAGSDDGARTWAQCASLLGTCKLNAINPQTYLTVTLQRIVDMHPMSRIDDLMPWNFSQ